MNRNDFIIQFGGLIDGVHNFVFDINKEFFDLIEYSELFNSNLKINLELNKMSSMIVLRFVSKGTIELVCDRCLDEFNYNIEFDETIYIKFGEEYQEVDSDVIFFKRGDTEIDILELIYQFIMINLPIKKIHPDDDSGNSTCNKKMLERIEALNSIETKIEQEEVLDSRWNELKKLKNGTSKKKDLSTEKKQKKNAL